MCHLSGRYVKGDSEAMPYRYVKLNPDFTILESRVRVCHFSL